MTTVHRFLVTSDFDSRMDMWSNTATYANWIEGRERNDKETWLVTVFDTHDKNFLEAAKRVGVTVEEISGAGDDEEYVLKVGEPGTGWGRAVRDETEGM